MKVDSRIYNIFRYFMAIIAILSSISDPMVFKEKIVKENRLFQDP